MATTEDLNAQRFRDRTESALCACADWLRDNAAQLADTFAGGGTGWSVEFRWKSDGHCPGIHIEVDKVDMDAIMAYAD